ncbi:MAG: hypothetical protein AAF715_20275 [Myxococcota bacterium]
MPKPRKRTTHGDRNNESVAAGGRRRFSAAYKVRIVTEADACTEPGKIAALLRREGLPLGVHDRRRAARGADDENARVTASCTLRRLSVMCSRTNSSICHARSSLLFAMHNGFHATPLVLNPTPERLPNTYADEATRSADVYVFAVHAHQDKATLPASLQSLLRQC